MAKITENLLVKGARGNLGKQYVYKTRGSRTYIARMPVVNKTVPTERQSEVRESFGEASVYAQGAMTSPALKKQYEKKATDGSTAFNIALRDFLKAPVVKKIATVNYNGAPGSIIVVKAKDDFKVVRVRVSIHTADGVLVEQGDAVINPINRHHWDYTASQINASPPGCVVTVTAFDLPGNEGTLEKTL